MSRRIARSRIFAVALLLLPLVVLATLPSGSHARETGAAEAPPCQVRWKTDATKSGSVISADGSTCADRQKLLSALQQGAPALPTGAETLTLAVHLPPSDDVLTELNDAWRVACAHVRPTDFRLMRQAFVDALAASSLAQDLAQASYPGATLRLDSVDNLYPIKAIPAEGKGVCGSKLAVVPVLYFSHGQLPSRSECIVKVSDAVGAPVLKSVQADAQRLPQAVYKLNLPVSGMAYAADHSIFIQFTAQCPQREAMSRALMREAFGDGAANLGYQASGIVPGTDTILAEGPYWRDGEANVPEQTGAQSIHGENQ